MESNALTDILAKGASTGIDLGSNWLKGLLGSQPANEIDLQREKNDWNKVNGSGPVNEDSANKSPKSWTEMIFGLPSSAKSGATAATEATSPKDQSLFGGLNPLIVLAILAGAVVFLFAVLRR